MNRSKLTALTVPAVIVVILDQLSKHWIRISPSYHHWEVIPGWLSFNYTQNPGMALGMRWASTEVISIVAIIATIGILTYVLYNREQATKGYLLCMGLVLGGAFGNIIDRLVMGYLESYGGLLEGHVVDFIHFDLVISGYPVFPYIFNVADVAISTAIIAMILFHKKVMPQDFTSPDGPDSIDQDSQAVSTHLEEE
ncbi:signal peptidase II [Fodinibius halophilus]|uniref:Lipoprotein signal peptidase n=1 Tax=Fodinibius halophilus TaxID=1736908 RepID=A0A6M1T535_9BACT|nr:signal peptidase II [Fodinibius halophilus]NGP89157.1 signal peptidase II [Fodinibius halophilus]